MTSQKKMMIAIPIDMLFDRANAKHTHQSDTSLILTVPGECNPVISISLFPVNGETRYYDIRFDNATQTFAIPDELKIEAAMPTVNAAEHCTTVAQFQHNFTRSFEEAVIQQQQNDRCFECHVPAKRVDDHAEKCGSKWYISRYQDVYVKMSAVRCVFRLGQPVRILKDGNFIDVQIDCIYFSPMADTLLKISPAGTIELLTTAFTRIRIPIVIDGEMLKEKLVLVTSADRTIVCANSARICDPKNAIGQFKCNTPLYWVSWVTPTQWLNLNYIAEELLSVTMTFHWCSRIAIFASKFHKNSILDPTHTMRLHSTQTYRKKNQNVPHRIPDRVESY